jgi:hypothetical protein
MKRNTLRSPRFWIPNNLSATLVTILLWSQASFATVLVVLVSGNAIVFGADSENIVTEIHESHYSPIGTGTVEKIAIIQNRLLVSTNGIGSISGIYDFNTWIKSLPIANNTSVENAATIIKKKAGPLFKKEWDWQVSHGRTPFTNLSGEKSLPWVSYYVGGNEFAGPVVYLVELYVDWTKNRLKAPIITLIYPPPKGVTQYKNILARHNGVKGGGIDQLNTDGSNIQRKYLKLYNREVGAAIYDEPLDVGGLAKLARILLTVEIEVSPKRFSFPIKICSAIPGQGPSCNTYEK